MSQSSAVLVVSTATPHPLFTVKSALCSLFVLPLLKAQGSLRGIFKDGALKGKVEMRKGSMGGAGRLVFVKSLVGGTILLHTWKARKKVTGD